MNKLKKFIKTKKGKIIITILLVLILSLSLIVLNISTISNNITTKDSYDTSDINEKKSDDNETKENTLNDNKSNTEKNTSNKTRSNTSNNTGSNTSNNTGSNTSNNTNGSNTGGGNTGGGNTGGSNTGGGNTGGGNEIPPKPTIPAEQKCGYISKSEAEKKASNYVGESVNNITGSSTEYGYSCINDYTWNGNSWVANYKYDMPAYIIFFKSGKGVMVMGNGYIYDY